MSTSRYVICVRSPRAILSVEWAEVRGPFPRREWSAAIDRQQSNPFPPRDQREYAAEAVERFPWPVVAGYEQIHRWMDQGLAVNAAWQVRDAWEALIKFLGAVAVSDFLANQGDAERTTTLLSILLKPRGLSIGDWRQLMQVALCPEPAAGASVPELALATFPPRWQRGEPIESLAGLIDGTGRDLRDDRDPHTFTKWRNKRFGHGVLVADPRQYVLDAQRWLDRRGGVG